MLAKLVDDIPEAGGFLFEPKWDGFRSIVFRSQDDVYIQSRDLKPLDRYFPELHEALMERLPPWHSNRMSRLIKTPKLHVGDTGVACAVLRLDADDLVADRATFGRLLETFVFQELRRQASWHQDPVEFFHFRDKDGVEVDIVAERGSSVAGIEVKASSTVTNEDFAGLRKLRQATGKRFAAGVVLYDGESGASFGDGLHAVPIRALWEPR